MSLKDTLIIGNLCRLVLELLKLTNYFYTILRPLVLVFIIKLVQILEIIYRYGIVPKLLALRFNRAVLGGLGV